MNNVESTLTQGLIATLYRCLDIIDQLTPEGIIYEPLATVDRHINAALDILEEQ